MNHTHDPQRHAPLPSSVAGRQRPDRTGRCTWHRTGPSPKSAHDLAVGGAPDSDTVRTEPIPTALGSGKDTVAAPPRSCHRGRGRHRAAPRHRACRAPLVGSQPDQRDTGGLTRRRVARRALVAALLLVRGVVRGARTVRRILPGARAPRSGQHRYLGVLVLGPGMLAVNDLPTVIDNLTQWVVGILAAAATLFLTIGGARYLMAGGDPGEVERAKGALKSAAVGYALAMLAPVFLDILRQILGV